MKIFIGCSSSNDIPEKYKKDCEKYLKIILKENDLVFGGDNTGLMSMSYNIARGKKREIIAASPKIFKNNINKIEYDKKVITEDIFDRTKELIKCSDASIFLPGGIGTIYEFFSLLESKRSHEFSKPIIINNCQNYYDKMFELLDKIYDENFSKRKNSKNYHISNSAEDTLNYLNNISK